MQVLKAGELTFEAQAPKASQLSVEVWNTEAVKVSAVVKWVETAEVHCNKKRKEMSVGVFDLSVEQ